MVSVHGCSWMFMDVYGVYGLWCFMLVHSLEQLFSEWL